MLSVLSAATIMAAGPSRKRQRPTSDGNAVAVNGRRLPSSHLEVLATPPVRPQGRRRSLLRQPGLTQTFEKVGIIFRPIPRRALAEKGRRRDRYRFSEGFLCLLYAAQLG
jgi:hypothetical protein